MAVEDPFPQILERILSLCSNSSERSSELTTNELCVKLIEPQLIKGNPDILLSDLLTYHIKQLLFKLIETAPKTHFPIDLVEIVINISLWCSESKEFADPSCTMLLLEDLLDIVTLETSALIFGLIETKVDRLVLNMEPNKGKGLVLLRFCNELLRKLSKVKNTVFCGRILMLLTNVFPLSERSGVNLKGDFNVENGTFFDESVGNEMQIDGMDEEEKNFKEFYNIFWNCQKYFSNPPLLFESASFEKFQKNLQVIYKELYNLYPISEKSSSRASPKRSSSSKNNNRDNELIESPKKAKRELKAAPNSNGVDAELTMDMKRQHFFPKYLTGWNLFRLELNDPFFVRQVLVQVLIILQFLSTLSSKEKEKQIEIFKTDPTITQNKSVVYQFQLTTDQELWVADMRRDYMNLLENIPPYGKGFAKTITTVISHERNWLKWKYQSCSSYEKESVSLDEKIKLVKRQRPAGSSAIRLTGQTPSLGCPELTRLWEIGSDLNQVMTKKADRIKKNVKTLGVYFEELDDQIELDGTVAEGVEDEYLLFKDPSFNWGAYRTAVRHNIHLFSKITKGIDTVGLLQQHRADIGKILTTNKSDSPVIVSPELGLKKMPDEVLSISITPPTSRSENGDERPSPAFGEMKWNLESKEFFPKNKKQKVAGEKEDNDVEMAEAE